MIDYQLIRSKRRTLSICVDREGALVVRAPMRLPKREIDAFVEKKKEWIEEKQRTMQRRKLPPPGEGTQIPYFGRLLTIRLADVKNAFVSGDTLYAPAEGDLRSQLLKWRMQEAQTHIAPRVVWWQEKTGISCSKLSFGNARSRWGMMNSRGEMRLSAMLVYCSMELCDYVIVHELCHVRHMDHSRAFHELVQSYFPDEKEKRWAMKLMGMYSSLLDE